MPTFDDDELEVHKLPSSNYGYSAAKIDDLTATEYTLVTIVMDESGSTSPFRSQLEKVVKEVVKACRHSPRADNLMLRLVAFGRNMREIHGFKLLESCNPDDYTGCYKDGGTTALYDSAENAIAATAAYAKQLMQNDFMVNAFICVITDGEDTDSISGQNEVKAALANCVQSESMESLVSILIGVNVNTPRIAQYLDDFNQKAQFSQYIGLDDATEKTLAKLANFVSQSISSQSQALGSGGASTSLTF